MVKTKRAHRQTHPRNSEPLAVYARGHALKPLLPRREYFARIARSFALGATVIFACLGIGMVGYHALENLSWMDAFLNASMILSGMGPAAALQTNGGKLFAGFYALFSGLALISIMGIIMAPVVLRFLHKFHLDLNATEDSPPTEHRNGLHKSV